MSMVWPTLGSRAAKEQNRTRLCTGRRLYACILCVCVVMLQPVSAGARPDADCAHKFIVETIFTPDGDIASLDRLVSIHH